MLIQTLMHFCMLILTLYAHANIDSSLACHLLFVKAIARSLVTSDLSKHTCNFVKLCERSRSKH